MRGKELAKLLQCIIDEQKVKWGRDALMGSFGQRYCALGLLAKGAGVPDEALAEADDTGGEGTPLYPKSGALKYIPELNDESASFLSFIKKLEEDKRNFAVKQHIRKLKKYAKDYNRKRDSAA